MNPFQTEYTNRLREWKNLRNDTKEKSLLEQCIIVDRWWQQTPLVNHNIHWNDQENWPDPWEILSDNTYCPLTRAVGICYTFILEKNHDLRLVTATDNQGDEVYLVIVGKESYVLNYWPNTVEHNKILDFAIKSEISIKSLLEKIK